MLAHRTSGWSAQARHTKRPLAGRAHPSKRLRQKTVSLACSRGWSMRARFWSWLVVVVVAQGCDCGSDGGSVDAGPIEDGGADAAEDSGSEPDAEVDAGQDAAAPDAETLDVFEAWREAREALQASPDHLPARANALIEAGDPEAIFEFVRDHIATYPSSAGGFQNAPDAIRWGVRGTLRGGAGSPREKAELLAFML